MCWRSGKSKTSKGAKSVLKLLKSRSKREKLTPAARADSSQVPAGAPAPGGLRRQRTEAAHKIAASVSRGVCSGQGMPAHVYQNESKTRLAK